MLELNFLSRNQAIVCNIWIKHIFSLQGKQISKNVSLKNSILYCVTSNQDTVIEIEDIKQAVTDLNINIIIFKCRKNQ